MTRKDYVGIAEVINRNYMALARGELLTTIEFLVEDLADYFKAENPRGFDRDTFVNNCTKIKGDKTR